MTRGDIQGVTFQGTDSMENVSKLYGVLFSLFFPFFHSTCVVCFKVFSSLNFFCLAHMSRMSLLMKEVYGEAAYNSSRQPRWEHLADRCSYAKMPEQGVNECGFYMLKVAYLYDGTKLVEEVKKRDVIFAGSFLFFN